MRNVYYFGIISAQAEPILQARMQTIRSNILMELLNYLDHLKFQRNSNTLKNNNTKLFSCFLCIF